MRNKTKIITAATAAVMLTAATAGCSPTTPAPQAPPSAPAAETSAAPTTSAAPLPPGIITGGGVVAAKTAAKAGWIYAWNSGCRAIGINVRTPDGRLWILRPPTGNVGLELEPVKEVPLCQSPEGSPLNATGPAPEQPPLPEATPVNIAAQRAAAAHGNLYLGYAPSGGRTCSVLTIQEPSGFVRGVPVAWLYAPQLMPWEGAVLYETGGNSSHCR